MRQHSGNMLNQVSFEEHDGDLNAKKVTMVSTATVFSGIISSTGNTTIFVAPDLNFFFLKDLHVSSLGRSEVEIRSGATTIIPFTSLSTTSGFFEYFGGYGKPSRATADSFVIGLNGGATISYAVTVRFGT